MGRLKDRILCYRCGERMILGGEEGGDFEPCSWIYVCRQCRTGKRVSVMEEDVGEIINNL